MVAEFLLWLCIAFSAMFLGLAIKFLFEGDKDLKNSFYGFVVFAILAFFLYLSGKVAERGTPHIQFHHSVETTK